MIFHIQFKKISLFVANCDILSQNLILTTLTRINREMADIYRKDFVLAISFFILLDSITQMLSVVFMMALKQQE